jgi:hypothetical protein
MKNPKIIHQIWIGERAMLPIIEGWFSWYFEPLRNQASQTPDGGGGT